jgi:segregation and condensation protein A
MIYQVAGHQTEQYRINIDEYEGPLDLLLELIQKSQLDITKLALAQVTDQYLAYLHNIKEQDAAQVSAFLVIAARLLLIKSEALLPRPIVRGPDEIDPGEALAQQLLVYRAFKKAAEWLAQREISHQKTFVHVPPIPKIEGKVDLNGITFSDLLEAANIIRPGKSDAPFLSEVITIPRITIREKIQFVLDTLKHNPSVFFDDFLLINSSKIEIVVTFLAILELTKRHAILLQQGELFAHISISINEEWIPTDEVELEFGD